MCSPSYGSGTLSPPGTRGTTAVTGDNRLVSRRYCMSPSSVSEPSQYLFGRAISRVLQGQGHGDEEESAARVCARRSPGAVGRARAAAVRCGRCSLRLRDKKGRRWRGKRGVCVGVTTVPLPLIYNPGGSWGSGIVCDHDLTSPRCVGTFPVRLNYIEKCNRPPLPQSIPRAWVEDAVW